MDEIDLRLILLLIFNSRLSYRELGNHINLSLNAVYKRIQNLIESGVIQRFTAHINAYAIGAIYCFIFGESKVVNLDNIIEKIENHENTCHIMISSRNYLYVGGFLKNIHELGNYSEFISKVAEIQSPKVGLRDGSYYFNPIPFIVPKAKMLNIDKLDFAIIQSIHKDARKPINEIADEVKSTSGTVRRRLKRLINEGLLELTIEFYPEASHDLYTILLIKIKPNTQRVEFSKSIVEKFQPNILYCWTFSNLPNTLLCWVWTNNINELNELVEKMKKESVESLITDIIRKGYFSDTWRDKLEFSDL